MPAESQRHNLPPQPNALLGRADALAYLRRALVDERIRLLTLVGPGGAGKTRLAVAAAEAVQPAFSGGVWFVDLTAVPAGEPNLLWLQVAETLGVAEAVSGIATVVAELQAVCAARQMLLVLDNVEHVMAATLPLSTLLDACPLLQVLATSRESLRLRREHTYGVEPLAVPRSDQPGSLEALAAVPSVALFVERARAVEPTFVLDAESADAVAELCTRLDGLPLAIELAAARSRVLSPRALLGRLVSRPSRMPSGPRDTPERHRTLWTTINWSYELLLEDERTLFRQLGVFAGAWSLESVESVCANLFDPADPIEALDRLSVLVDKSLVRPEAGPDGEPAFRVLETLREFAIDQLRGHGEYRAAAERHAAYYVGLSEAAEPNLIGAQQKTWLARLQREHDNLRAALRWTTESGDVANALRLSGALWRFWWLRGHLNEGLHWLRQALAMPGEAPLAARAKALHAAGKLSRERGDPSAAEVLCRESLALFQNLNDQSGVALVLNTLGNIEGDRGDHGAARVLYEQSLALRRALGDLPGTALALHNLAALARSRGDLTQATALGDESLSLFQTIDDAWGIGIGLAGLARVALLEHRPAEAEALARESLHMRQVIGDRRGIVLCLEILSEVAVAGGQLERAARLMGAVDALREAMGLHRPLDEAASYEEHMGTAREGLGDERFTHAWESGRETPTEDAIVYAMSESGLAEEAHPAADLSQRELQVARLVAQGMTNRQIAEELIISRWTANHHVASILRKLNLVGRAQVTGWLATRDLLASGGRGSGG